LVLSGVKKNGYQPSFALVIEYFEDSNWLGGSIYIDNLLAILSSLKPDGYPTVQLVFLSSPFTPLAQQILKHSVVEPEVRNNYLSCRFTSNHRAIWITTKCIATGQ
jgi:hypothetical protein